MWHLISCSNFATVLTRHHFFLPHDDSDDGVGGEGNGEITSVKRKTKLLGDKQSPRSLIHHKSQVACPGTELGPERRKTVACTRVAMNRRQAELHRQSLGEQRCAQRSNYSDERAI